MMHAVIMAGGSGTRFWPRSRKSFPKQFLDVGGETLLQKAVRRLCGLVPENHIWIITNAQHVDLVCKQVPELPREHVIGEPVGRDTAPCVGLGALLIRREDPDATIVTTPADHLVEPKESFQKAIRVSGEACQDGTLMTLGIRPRYPSTQFGYIERAGNAQEIDGLEVYSVAGFREKPDLDTATEYVRSGKFYWNCGIFVWRADAILDNLQKHAHDVWERLCELDDVPLDKLGDALKRVYPNLRKISIDYAVMERAERIKVVPAPFEWDDVGSWLAAPRLFGEDANGNTTEGLCYLNDTKGSIVLGGRDHLVVAFGISDLVVVHTTDATLVTTREHAANLKSLIEQLEKEGYQKFL